MKIRLALALMLAGGSVSMAGAAGDPAAKPAPGWNEPVEPFKVFANTWYVGTRGLSSLLITSDFGHVLIDAGLPESAPIIAANIEKLGFKVEDIKAILHSDAHPDPVGGSAGLQRRSGAAVYARRPAEAALRAGRLPHVWVVQDDQLLGVGSIRLRVLATPGHTPGGTSWAWDSCEGKTCLHMVYADSLTPVAGGKYRFSDHPEVVAQFEASFRTLEGQPCDVIVTPQPDATDALTRARQANGDAEALKDPESCHRYVATARQHLADRLAQEKSG